MSKFDAREYVKSKYNKNDDKDKKQKTTQKTKTTLSARDYVKEKYRKQKAEELGLDTLETDLNSLGTTIQGIYGGWQTEETMRNTRSSIESMYNRLTSYQDYRKTYGITEGDDKINDLVNAYKTTLDDWDGMSAYYGEFKNADAYNKAEQAKAKDKKRKQDAAKADLNVVQSEISSLESIFKKATEYTNKINKYDTANNAAQRYSGRNGFVYNANNDNTKNKNATQKELDKFLKGAGYSSVEELEAALKDKQSFLEEAKAIQEKNYFTERAWTGYGISGYEKYLEDEYKRKEYAEANQPSAFEEGVMRSFTTSSDNPISTIINNVIYDKRKDDSYQKPNSEWSQEAKYEFGARYLENPVKAYEWAAEYNNSLAEEKKNATKSKVSEGSTSNGWSAVGNWIGARLTAPLGLADYLDDLTDVAAGRDTIVQEGVLTPFEYSQTVGESQASALNDWSGTLPDYIPVIGGKGVGDAYGLANSIVDSRLSATTMGAYGTLLNYFGQAGASGVDDAVSRGADGRQALLYGTATGFAEAVPEMMSAKSYLKLKDAKDIGFFGKLNKQGLEEMREEGLTSIMSNAADNAIMGEKSQFNIDVKNLMLKGLTKEEATRQVWYNKANDIGFDALGGYISGSAGSVSQAARATKHEKYIRDNYGESAEDLIAEGLEGSKDSEAYKLATEAKQKIESGKELTTEELSQLVSANTDAYQQEVSADAKKRLSKLGSTDDNSALADIIAKKTSGVGLTKSEAKTLQNSQYGNRVFNEINYEDLVTYTENMSESDADLFLSQYNGKADIDAYASSFNLAMEYAKHDSTQGMMIENKGVLDLSQVKAIHNATVHSQFVEQSNKVKAVTEKHAKSLFVQGTFNDSIIDRDNKTTDGSKVNYKDLTPQQRRAVKFAELFSKATGVNIKLIKSDVRFGKHKGKNGQYDPKTNTIELDVFAGRIDAKSLNDAIIPTLSHEMTHWMKYKSPAIYESIREDVMKTLADHERTDDKGEKYKFTETDLVKREMERIQKAHPEINVTEDYAIDDLVARACEDALANSNSAKKLLSKMSKTEQNDFIAKVKETFDNIIQWINDLLSIYKSGSEEAQILREHKEMFEKISKQWDAMLETAIESNQALQNEGITGEQLADAQKNTTDKGDVKYEDRPFAEQVDDVLDGTFDRANAVYVGATPQILQDIGLNGELPMLTTARHIRNANKPKNTAKHHHGLTEAQIKNIPEKIAKPVMIMDSLDATRNSVVVVTDMVDVDKSPIVVSIKTDGKGMYNNVEIDSNFLTGYYGRDGFANFMENNVAEDTFLYINKEKATILSTESSTSWLEQLKNYDFNVIIRKTRANVKENSVKYSDRDVLEQKQRELQKEFNSLNKEVEEIKNGEKYKYFMDSFSTKLGEELDTFLNEYGEWTHESGLYDKTEKMSEITGELKDIRAALEDERKMSRDAYMKSIENLTEKEKMDFVKKAVERYGTTNKVSLASYLTLNGKMLDFSDGQGYRVQDHREISEILDMPDSTEYSDSLIAFMNMGNIRMQTYGIDISQAPNQAQKTALRDVINQVMRENDEFSIDFSKTNGYTDGSVTYPKGTSSSKILEDIESYFKTGVVPEYNSSIAGFRYSDRDSDGNALSKGQKTYFADSKMRDDDGNLMVMYQGSQEEFFEFDRKKSSPSNLYGRGFYFTNSKSHAEQYGNARGFYLNIENPLSPAQNNITKKQMLNFLKAVENNGEDYDLYNYGEGATAQSVLNSVWGKGDFEMLQDISASAIGDLVAAVELFNEVNGTTYDGIILPTETITFNSEQAKLTSNKNPTENKDMRYSDRDSDYMDAVNRGDMETAKKLLDDYAIEKGYTVDADGVPELLFHGTDSFGFTTIDTSKSDDKTTFWATPNMGVAGSYYEGSNYKVREIGKEKVSPKGEKIQPYHSMEKAISMASPFSSNLNMDLGKAKYVKESAVMRKVKKTLQKAVKACEVVLEGDYDAKTKNIAQKVIGAYQQGNYESLARAINQSAWQQYAETTGIRFWEIDLPDNFNPDKSDISKVTEADADVFKMMYHIGDVLDQLSADYEGKLNGEEFDKSDIALPYNEHIAEKGIYGFYHKENNPFVYDCEGAQWNKIEVPAEAKAYFGDGLITTRQLAQWAFENGYDSIRLDNVIDVGGFALQEAMKPATVWAFKNPSEQLKSADPVTYDNDGNIIPLSERFNKKNDDIRYSDRDRSTYAPTFYSHMGKTINEIKQDKIGANSVVSYLKGKGVKNEEIKWSGIESFLEGKKSVTKQELLDFINSSMLQIGEQMSDAVDIEVISEDGDNYIVRNKETRETLDEWEWDDDVEDGLEGWVNQDGEIALTVDEIREKSFKEFSSTRWSEYKLDGGTNYREILFTMPNSTYSNYSMQGHWGDDAQGILAHARIQDFDVDGKKMLFVEEIQSDWHNFGHKNGYVSKDIIENQDKYEKDIKDQISQDSRMARFVKKFGNDNVFNWMQRRAKLNNNDGERVYNYLFNKAGFHFQRKAEMDAVAEHYDKIQAITPTDIQAHEAPFKDNYHEFVLKNLLRNAAENGYDSIGWTPAEVQSKRWSDEYAEGYRIEYDQDMPKFLKKYGKQWGATVGATTLPNGTEVWSMDITDSMRDSVLYEGQVMYSDRIEESVYDKLGETARLVKENAKLKEDVDRLKERLKIERQVTHGNFFNRNQLDAVAGHIRNIADSNYDKKELVNSINSIYQYIAHSSDLNWEDLYSQCYDVADKVLDKSRPITETNPYYQDIVDDIRKTKISVNEQQIQNAKYRLGNRWRNSFFNKVTISDNGISLDSQWQEWSSMYPNIFDAELSDADQLVELLDIYDSVRQASETVVEYDKEERTRWLAREIYNQYWNVSTIRTTADKYDKQIKRLNFEHRKAMQEFRESYDAKLKEQHKIDKEKAQELVKNIRERKDREIAEVKQKSKEMMSAYKENAEKKTKIQSITSNALTLNKWLKDNSKDHHINETLKPVVVNLLQAIDFSSKQMLNKNIPTQKDISLYKALQDVKNMFANANNETALSDLTEMYGIDMDEDITKMLDSAFDTLTSLGDNGYILNKMNLDELNTLNKVVKTIKQVVTKLNKFHIANHFKGVTNLSQNSIVYFDKLGQAKVYDPSKLKGRVAKLLNWSNATPYYAFKRFGDGGKVMFEALQDGQDKLAFNIKSIIDYSNKAYTNKEVREWSEEVKSIKVHDMITNKDVTVQITVAQAMSLYCSLKREQAQGHILGDGIRITDITAKKGKVISQAEGVKLSVDDLSALTGILTNKQIQVADKLQEFMNTVCTEWGNEISMARFGYKAFGEPNYFPISSDKNNLAVDDAKEESNSLFRLLNMSFTKSVKEGANNKVEIKNIFDVFAQHSSDMAKYNAFALPVLDFYKWYNYTEKGMVNGEKRTVASLKASMEKAFGKDAKEYVTTFLKDINGQYDVSRDTLGKGFFKNAKIAAVGMNLRVVLLQPTSYFRASAVIDNKYLAKALLHKPKVSKATKHCGMALWKSLGYYDTNIQRGVTDQIKHNETWKDKAVEVSMKGAEVADKITWGYLWNACELEIRDTRKDLQVGSQEFYDAISKRLRDVIYATQVVDSTMTRSQMMRSQGMYDKMLTSFASEPTLAYNMVVDAFETARLEKRADGKISGNSVKKIARVVAAYTVTNAVAALVESGFDAFRDEDDEEMDLTEFMKLYFTNFAFDMSLTAKIPYVKEFVSIMQGFTSSRTDTQWMQSLGYALKGWYKVLAGDGKPVSALKNSLRSLSYLSGMPFYNAYRDTMALLDKLDVLTAEEIEKWLEDLFS